MSTQQRVPRNGRTIREAAQITGLSERSIRRWTSEPRDVYLAKTARRRDEIRALKAAEPKLSMRAIADRIGCSVGTVHNALKH